MFEVTFARYSDASDVLDRIREIVNTYDCVTWSDVCDLVGLPSSYSDTKIRWSAYKIYNDTKIVPCRSGYRLVMPAECIDDRELTTSEDTAELEPRDIHVTINTADMDDPDCLICSAITHLQKIKDRDIFITIY